MLINTNVKAYGSQKDFFKDLSKQNFDAKISIDSTPRGVKAWTILQEVKPQYTGFAKVLAFGLGLLTGAREADFQTKEKFANNLKDLVEQNESQFGTWGCNFDIMKKNLGELGKKIAQNLPDDDSKKLSKIFDAAIQASTKTRDAQIAKAAKEAKEKADKARAEAAEAAKAKFEADVKRFSEQPPEGLTKNDQISTEQFYEHLGNTPWFGLVGGYKKRFHLNKNKDSWGYSIYETPKKTLWQKFNTRDFVPVQEKIAALTELRNFLDADKNFRRKVRANVDGMIYNLSESKPKMIRHTSKPHAELLTKLLDEILDGLKEDSKVIAEARSKDLARRCGRAGLWSGKNLVLRPVLWTGKQAFNLTKFGTKHMVVRPALTLGSMAWDKAGAELSRGKNWVTDKANALWDRVKNSQRLTMTR